ncbi:MAG: helix-turn-helix transcriptional regulator [Campylobacterales bacterium]|nr:helix-turn-helix transcriptional regulator [Campylobacterales bacterium]
MNKNLSNVTSEEIQEHYKRIGNFVKQQRELHNISQLQMALAIGIKSVAFYSNCENSKNDKHFNIEHIYKICKLLDIPLSDFYKSVEQLH